METYKSLSVKYSDEDVKRLSGVVSWISYKRLLTESINEAVGLKRSETIVALVLDKVGITVHIENTTHE